MSASETLGSGEPDWSLSELQRLLLAPTPEALERAVELAVALRGRGGSATAETRQVLEKCKTLAQHAADYYLGLKRIVEVRLAPYAAGGRFRSLEAQPWRVDARA